jgi:hypothetical protein
MSVKKNPLIKRQSAEKMAHKIDYRSTTSDTNNKVKANKTLQDSFFYWHYNPFLKIIKEAR